MPQFKAVVLTATGVFDLNISAESLADARTTAESRGQVLQLSRSVTLLARGMTPPEREAFLTKLASLLEARIGTGQALRLIREEFDGRVRLVADEMLRHIESGSGLAEAMIETGPEHFPPALVALTQAGLRAGNSAQALEAACQFEIDMQELSQTTGKGLFSAASGFVSAVAVSAISTYWIGPTVTQSMSAMSRGKSADLGWALSSGNILTISLLLLMVALLGLTFISTVGRRINPHLADAITHTIPIWGAMRLGKERFLGMYSLSALVKAGLPMEKALSITAGSLPPGRLQEQFAQAVEAVEAGENWTPAFIDLASTDRAALSSASDRSQAVVVLARVASAYRRLFQHHTEAFVLTLQLISAVALTAGGGLLFVLSILPMLQTASAIM